MIKAPVRIFLSLILVSGLLAGYAIAGVSEEFKEKLLKLKWIAYAPTHFDPQSNIYPSEDSIREDLELLYNYGFNGIVTYGSESSLAQVPRIAKAAGFRGVIMGIWNIQAQDEIMNAKLANPYVDGYCVGNEGLNSRYDAETLRKAIAGLKQSTNKPVTTTEQAQDYFNDEVFAIGDWIFPNIHPFLCNVKDCKKATKWIENHYRLFKKRCPPDKIILFKEIGYPTAGMLKASEKNQEEFFLNVQKSGIPFVYFEAFDQRWKRHLPVEPYWGLFNHNRKPKKFIHSPLENLGLKAEDESVSVSTSDKPRTLVRGSRRLIAAKKSL